MIVRSHDRAATHDSGFPGRDHRRAPATVVDMSGNGARSLLEPTLRRVISEARASGLTPSPADWRDVWIYFLMVDRFNRPDAPPRHQPWDDPSFDGYQGGMFVGVQAGLPYLKDLGAGAIWLSPVLKNLPFDRFGYHGYGIHDFLHAEPRFATVPENADEELRALVDAAHEAGLYVIFDIVLNHVGDVFAYEGADGDGLSAMSGGAQHSYSATPLNVQWRDASGTPSAADDIATITDPTRNALVWPVELQRNNFFRRQGVPGPSMPDTFGDFVSLKQMRTEDGDLQRALVEVYQYVIARWDVDGFRIDTLRYLHGGLPRVFGNAMREFAETVGKKNFFTFGEVFDPQAEQDIAKFIGRTQGDADDMVGVDAALDYPLYFALPPIVKGFDSPSRLYSMFDQRRRIEGGVTSSHGDATRYFVTFLDNHDVKQRLRYVESDGSHPYDDQVTLALALLFALPGIPAVYYGTEQGLHGAGSDAAVREAMWGGPGLKPEGPFYNAIRDLTAVRKAMPALRYGRPYARPLSGDGVNFGLSTMPHGVVAFSRIVADQEVLIVANTHPAMSQNLHVVVDGSLNEAGNQMTVEYSNLATPTPPEPFRVFERVSVAEADGTHGTGPLMTCRVRLRALEVQILSNA
jgi:glycosidase